MGNHSDLVFLGRFVKAKGMDYLIEAFTKFNVMFPNSECIFIGDGDYLQEFKDKYGKLEGVKIKGYLPEEEMLDTLVDSDVFVNPTYLKEGIVLVNIQAMKLGVPVIATDTGASSEAIENYTDGLLITPKDTEQLFTQMMFLSRFEDVQRLFAKNAKERAKEFNAFDSGKNLERILLEIVNKKRE